ncbi:MAG: hypothetical protein PVH65_00740 [Chloroflexota bacterium]|jgi:hypothetical protein
MIAGSPAGEIFDRLQSEAESYSQSDQVEIDPHLADRTNDRRLGLLVIGRPDPALRERFASFLNQVKLVAPEQHLHFYLSSELHLVKNDWYTLQDRVAIIARYPLAQGP